MICTGKVLSAPVAASSQQVCPSCHTPPPQQPKRRFNRAKVGESVIFFKCRYLPALRTTPSAAAGSPPGDHSAPAARFCPYFWALITCFVIRQWRRSYVGRTWNREPGTGSVLQLLWRQRWAGLLSSVLLR